MIVYFVERTVRAREDWEIGFGSVLVSYCGLKRTAFTYHDLMYLPSHVLPDYAFKTVAAAKRSQAWKNRSNDECYNLEKIAVVKIDTSDIYPRPEAVTQEVVKK